MMRGGNQRDKCCRRIGAELNYFPIISTSCKIGELDSPPSDGRARGLSIRGHHGNDRD